MNRSFAVRRLRFEIVISSLRQGSAFRGTSQTFLCSHNIKKAPAEHGCAIHRPYFMS